MDNKTKAILSRVFPILFFLALIGDKDDYVMYHANQALLQLILAVAISIIFPIPILGWIVGAAGYIFSFVCWVLGIIYAAQGEMKPLPLIGGIVLLK